MARHLAKTLAVAVRNYVNDKKLEGLVFATCHDDFVPWLQPDWVFSTQTKELAILAVSDPAQVRLACRIHAVLHQAANRVREAAYLIEEQLDSILGRENRPENRFFERITRD